MIETLRKEWQVQVLVISFLLLTVWFFVSPTIRFSESTNNRFLGDFASIYFIVALWGSLCGFWIAKKWGFSLIGKTILFFSLGLLGQVFGQLAYAYLSFYKHVSIPYPSLGDIGYFASVQFYICGAYLLSKASGAHINLKSISGKLQLIVIPFVIYFVGYVLFLRGYVFDWSNPIKIFLDFSYPIGQATYIAIVIITYSLSRGVLGGLMKSKIVFLLLALAVQFLADFVFLIQAHYETWSVGGWNDYMYLVAYFLMSFALLQLKTLHDQLNAK